MLQDDPCLAVRGPIRRVEVHHDVHGDWTATELDREGRVVLCERKGPNGYWSRASTFYDPYGRVTQVETEFGGGQRSVSRYVYEAGRLVRIEGQSADGVAIQPTVFEYMPDGSRAQVVSLAELPSERNGVKIHFDPTVAVQGTASRRDEYNAKGHKTLTCFFDQHGQLLAKTQYTYDEASRLVDERQTWGDVNPIVEALRPNVPAELLAVVTPLAAQGRRVTYRYDDNGREVEKHTAFPPFSDDTVRKEYNDLGDLCRLEVSHRRPDGDSGEIGDETVSVSAVEYVYDARGNWIHRVWRNRAPDREGVADVSQSTRVIEYYD